MKASSIRPQSSFWNAPSLFAGVTTLLVTIFLFARLVDQHRYVRSDDALVKAHYTPIQTKVPGIVKAIFVDEHDTVKKDQVLALIDRREYQSQHTQRLEIARSIQAQLENAQVDWKRSIGLYAKGIYSTAERDKALALYERRKAQIIAEQSSAEMALIRQEYAVIRAPEDGVIAVRSVSSGAMVKAGDPLFGVVYSSERWIEAKIKETDLHDVHLGENVQVEIDAIPDHNFQGKIQSLSPTTEGLQAPVIPDNGAGNFTKYVQWVPVKVSLALSPEERQMVRAGLSASIRIRR